MVNAYRQEIMIQEMMSVFLSKRDGLDSLRVVVTNADDEGYAKYWG